METDIGLQFLLLTSYEFLLYQLHMSYFPRKHRSKPVEVLFCSIAIKHHMPKWYDIMPSIAQVAFFPDFLRS